MTLETRTAGIDEGATLVMDRRDVMGDTWIDGRGVRSESDATSGTDLSAEATTSGSGWIGWLDSTKGMLGGGMPNEVSSLKSLKENNGAFFLKGEPGGAGEW